MIILGLTGYARAGKDTVADFLVAEYGFQKVSFARPLKDMLLRLNPIMGSQLIYKDNAKVESIRLSDLYDIYGDEEGIKASVYGDEARALWQRLGTDCLRAVDPDFWVNAAMKQLNDSDGRYVFPDTRFPNEANAIYGHQHWGDMTVWQVTRPGINAVNGHESEAHVGKMHERFVLSNNGTLADLESQIRAYAHISFGL